MSRRRILAKPHPHQRRDAVWVRCTNCDEFWCLVHHAHAFECPCPPIEDWDGSPYEPLWTQ